MPERPIAAAPTEPVTCSSTGASEVRIWHLLDELAPANGAARVVGAVAEPDQA